MNYRKNILSFLLVVVVSFYSSLTSYAAELTVSAPNTVESYRVFNVKISVRSEVPLSAVQMNIGFGESINFKKAELLQNGRIRTFVDSETAQIICLANDGFLDGELVQLELSTKRNAGTAEITVEPVQIVDVDMNDVESETVLVSISVSGSTGSDTSDGSSHARDSAVNSAPAASASVSRNSSSSSKAASSKSSFSKSVSDSDSGDESYGGKRAVSDSGSDEYEETVSAVYYEKIGYLDRDETETPAVKYVFSGALGAAAVFGFIAAFYRLGIKNGRKK